MIRVKLVDQDPMNGRACIFYFVDGTVEEGHWEWGGAYKQDKIILYNKDRADIGKSDFHLIIEWEYKK